MSEQSTTTQRQQRRARHRLTRSGGISFWIATALLALIDALGIYLVVQLASNASWSMAALFAVALIAVNLTYLNPRTRASRWLVPGMVLMLIFIVYPVMYTTYISFTNYQTGNRLSKDQAIARLEQVDITSEGPSETVNLRVYQNPAGDLALLVGSDTVEAFFGPLVPAGSSATGNATTGDATSDSVGSDSGADGASDADVISLADLSGQTIDFDDPPATIGDYELLDNLGVLREKDAITEATVNLPSGVAARVQTTTQAQIVTTGKRFTYDAATDTLHDAELDLNCTPDRGNFVCNGVPKAEVKQVEIEANKSKITCTGETCDNVSLIAIDRSLSGWQTVVGPENYIEVLTNARIRQPFLRVFAWNIVFAFGSVLLNFALGLGLAMALNKESMRGRAIYRSIYIIPYAIPGFLSIFVWRGLLSSSGGKVNSLIETFGLPGPNWLGTTGGAMAAVILVNLWLGFPYMFLINSGALTSIPDELIEAARVDGAGPFRVFRSVTLPLLLVSTAPLLIGAFAFNFNNFVLIFLLTGGGPPLTGYDVSVGATDILISFTFKIANASGQNYGLATAIVVLIFIFLATASALSFRLTKKLEEIYE